MQLKAADSSIVIMLGCIEAATRGMHPTKREQAKILVNVVFFVAPVVLAAVQNSNFQLLGGIALFVVAGLVITADRHRCILGVRCENWFHYCLGIAAYIIALGL